jgi:hypothetical protein
MASLVTKKIGFVNALGHSPNLLVKGIGVANYFGDDLIGVHDTECFISLRFRCSRLDP